MTGDKSCDCYYSKEVDWLTEERDAAVARAEEAEAEQIRLAGAFDEQRRNHSKAVRRAEKAERERDEALGGNHYYEVAKELRAAKAALREIAGAIPCQDYENVCNCQSWLIRVAREALEAGAQQTNPLYQQGIDDRDMPRPT